MLIYSVETERLRAQICGREAKEFPPAQRAGQSECAGWCGCLLGEQYRRREEQLLRAICPAEHTIAEN